MTRIDQRFEAVDRRFDQVDRQLERIWNEFRDVRGDIAAVSRQMTQIGWGRAGVLLIQLIAMFVIALS